MKELLGFQELLAESREGRPLLMVDRLEIDTCEGTATAIKAVSMNEPFFPGHFPGSPIMPGVLQVAALFQTASILLQRQTGQTDSIPWLAGIHRLRFRRPVYPGDVLLATVAVKQQTEEGVFLITGRTSVDGTTAAQGSFRIALRSPDSFKLTRTELCPELPEISDLKEEEQLSAADMMAMIPHRFPFFLVDRALKLDVEQKRSVGIKNVSGNEPFFQGLRVAIMPNYLQIEAAAQVACALALRIPEHRGKLGYFVAIDDVQFLRAIVPGDRVLMDLSLTSRNRFGKAEGGLYVGQELVSEVVLKFAMVDRE